MDLEALLAMSLAKLEQKPELPRIEVGTNAERECNGQTAGCSDT
jgi:hypothetical protein